MEGVGRSTLPNLVTPARLSVVVLAYHTPWSEEEGVPIQGPRVSTALFLRKDLVHLTVLGVKINTYSFQRSGTRNNLNIFSSIVLVYSIFFTVSTSDSTSAFTVEVWSLLRA